MEKFRREGITLVWLEYPANRKFQEYVGFSEVYCPNTIPTALISLGQLIFCQIPQEVGHSELNFMS